MTFPLASMAIPQPPPEDDNDPFDLSYLDLIHNIDTPDGDTIESIIRDLQSGSL